MCHHNHSQLHISIFLLLFTYLFFTVLRFDARVFLLMLGKHAPCVMIILGEGGHRPLPGVNGAYWRSLEGHSQ